MLGRAQRGRINVRGGGHEECGGGWPQRAMDIGAATPFRSRYTLPVANAIALQPLKTSNVMGGGLRATCDAL
eukprot:11227536-Lingulodinium_polyedra.AAC.1